MLDWLERNQFLALGLAGLILLCGLAARDLLASDDPPPIFLQPSAALRPGEPIRVHVAGAVVAPGVYTLRAGERVEDAIAAAGGASGDADLHALNLARPLRDGEKIDLPLLTAAETSDDGFECPAGPFDLNVATEEELECLDGIGEAYSRRIVDSRAVDGPYQSVDDLAARNLLPAATFEQIVSHVTVSAP